MKSIKPSQVEGIIIAPGSKSMMIRAVAASLLAKGRSEILNPSYAEDCIASIEIVEALGAIVKKEKDRIIIESNPLNPKQTKINCKESGLCMRMFAPIVALLGEEISLKGEGSLLKRSVAMVEEPLKELGAECKSNNGLLPLSIKGPIQGGKITIDGSKTSQFLTGLLIVLPLCEKDSEIEVKNLKSKPYVKITLSLLREFGIQIEPNKELSELKIKGNQEYKPSNYTVEGDWSGAAFLLVAGAIGGKVKVTNLNLGSEQADARIIEVLERVGTKINKEENLVEIEKNELNSFEFDATDCPDLFPPLVVLAANCKGKSRIKGVERLRGKESDRASALQEEFKKLGIEVNIKENEMEVVGGEVKGGRVDSHNDHRIAMACAIAGINSKDLVEIENPDCVSKSYPEFFKDLEKLGVNIE